MNEVAQSCPTLCDPMDCSLPGSSVHGNFQARVLEWAATSFSKGSSWPRDPAFQAGTLPSEPSGKSYSKFMITWLTIVCNKVFSCHVWMSKVLISSIQFSSVAQSCPTLCDPMNRSTPGPAVHHHLPEFTQAHVHRVDDAIQPSHPLSSPSPPAPNPSQHQSLFQWVNSRQLFITVAKCNTYFR